MKRGGSGKLGSERIVRCGGWIERAGFVIELQNGLLPLSEFVECEALDQTYRSHRVPIQV